MGRLSLLLSLCREIVPTARLISTPTPCLGFLIHYPETYIIRQVICNSDICQGLSQIAVPVNNIWLHDIYRLCGQPFLLGIFQVRPTDFSMLSPKTANWK